MDFSAVHQVDISTDNAERIFSRVDETTTALTRKVEKFNDNVIQARERFAAQHGDKAKIVGKEAVRKLVNSDTENYRRNLVSETKKEREALLAALGKQERDANSLAELYSSPAAFLGRIGLGSSTHANLIASLSGAGPVELEQRAREALMTGNRILASAILTVVDRMPNKDRPFTAAAFADAAVGKEQKELAAKFEETNRRLRAARDLNSGFVSGASDPLSKIARGVSSRQAKGA